MLLYIWPGCQAYCWGVCLPRIKEPTFLLCQACGRACTKTVSIGFILSNGDTYCIYYCGFFYHRNEVTWNYPSSFGCFLISYDKTSVWKSSARWSCAMLVVWLSTYLNFCYESNSDLLVSFTLLCYFFNIKFDLVK